MIGKKITTTNTIEDKCEDLNNQQIRIYNKQIKFVENNITGDFHSGSHSIYKNVSESKLGKKRLFPSEINLEGKDFFESIQ